MPIGIASTTPAPSGWSIRCRSSPLMGRRRSRPCSRPATCGHAPRPLSRSPRWSLRPRTTAPGLRCNDGQGDAPMINAPERGGDRRLHPKPLEILVCPLTKTSLDYDAERQELISRAAGLAYPIRDGIPIMLPEEARKLDEG